MEELLKNVSKLSPEKRKLLELLLKEQNVDINNTRILPQSRQTNRFPLSFAQQRMWFLDRLEPGNPMYNNPAAVSITGKINVEAITMALDALSARHEVLRTVFEDDAGTPVQIVQEESVLSLQQIDFSDLPDSDKKEALQSHSIKEALAPFDLKTGPLMRTVLITMGPDDYVFLLTMHHIISDAWTLSIFIKEFAELYESFVDDSPVQLADLPIQYVDFACWQRNYLQGETLSEQLGYWKEVLQDADHAMNLPCDHTRPKIQTFNGEVAYFTVDASITGRLETFSKIHDVTFFMTAMAALHLLFYRYTGQENISIGTPIANRNRSEVEFLLGVFVNTLVMRSDVGDNPAFIDLLKRVKTNALGAFAHQDIPFETLVEELRPERDMSRPPYFQVMFVMQNAPVQALQLKGAVLEPLELHTPTAKYDLTVVLESKAGGLDGQIVYNTDLFEPATIDRFVGHLKNVLAAIPGYADKKLSEFPLLTENEKQKLVFDLSASGLNVGAGQKCVHELFQDQLLENADSVIKCGHESVAYRDFNERANAIAHRLIAAGVAEGSIVGVYLERSVDLLAGMMAVLKAGGAILPLDPDYPIDRIFYMLNDSGASRVITSSALSIQLSEAGVELIDVADAAVSGENPDRKISLDSSAYVIYTSGSTGKPKGVVITQAAFAVHCTSMAEYYMLEKTDRVLQFASTNFDASFEQIFPTLLSGADMVMRDNSIWTPQALARIIKEEKLTVVNLPTAYWNQFIQLYKNDEYDGSTVKLLIVGGDLMRTDSLAIWQASSLRFARLLNAYGPTEAVITATIFDIPADFSLIEDGALPIGRPTPGRKIYILDQFGEPTPQGVAGELCIGGDLLARGYLNRPELTAEKFVSNPFVKEAERLYRTGDLARFNVNGNIEFLGRVDDQVKIRGYRIELGEIETTLKQYDGIEEAVVVARDEEGGDKRLIAYFIFKESEPRLSDLRQFLAARLPDYMMPVGFMALDEFPMTPSGKVDRKALPLLDQIRPAVGAEYVAPRSKTEERLAEIMKSVLRVEKVGIHDNFFELGGHSMLGTQIIAQVQQEFQVELPLRALFENPSVEGMAIAIAEELVQDVDEDDLQEMLDELDGLSNEEINKLLSDD